MSTDRTALESTSGSIAGSTAASTSGSTPGSISGATSPDKAHPAETPAQRELRARADLARQELASTLDAIEYKLNVPRQVRATRRRVTGTLRGLGEDNPFALVGVAIGAAVVAGAAVWAGVRAVQRGIQRH
jgi:hypothetical protein